MTNDKDCQMATQRWRDSLSPEHCRHFTAWQIAEQAFKAGAAWRQSRQGETITDGGELMDRQTKAANDCILKLAASLEWRPIGGLQGAIGREPILVVDEPNNGCPFIAFQMPARTEWMYYFEGVEFTLTDYTHFMPLPTGQAGEIIRVLVGALNEIGSTHSYLTEMGAWKVASDAMKRAAVIAKGQNYDTK